MTKFTCDIEHEGIICKLDIEYHTKKKKAYHRCAYRGLSRVHVSNDLKRLFRPTQVERCLLETSVDVLVLYSIRQSKQLNIDEDYSDFIDKGRVAVNRWVLGNKVLLNLPPESYIIYVYIIQINIIFE